MPFRFRLPPRSARGLPGRVGRIVLAGVALAGAACNDATAPLPTDGPPRELTYATHGFILPLVAVRLAGDTVVWVSYGGGTDSTVVRRVPSSDDWRAFWRTVDAVGLRNWPASCSTDVPEADVGGFSYSLAWSGERHTGAYTGMGPTRAGACSATWNDANAFTGAVYELAGVPYAVAL